MSATPKRNGSHVYNEVSQNFPSVFLANHTTLFSPQKLSLAMPPKTFPGASHPPLGTLIDNGAFELVEVIGIGGYGVVYRAVDTHSAFPKSYAVKCLVDPQPGQGGRQRQIHIR